MGRPGGIGKAAGKELQVSVPSFFRCPISLDVMKSPVSLCTGVTYDRTSIRAWLDAGHNTCPATMQVLPTTDFVPNHTLRRLIQVWSAQPPQQHPHSDADAASPVELFRRLQSSADALPPLRKLAEIAGDSSRIQELVENADCVSAVNGVLIRKERVLEEVELAVKVLSPVLLGRRERGYEIDMSLGKTPTLSSLLAVLKEARLESRVAAAWVVDCIASGGPEAKLLVAGTEGLLAELLRLLSDEDGKPAGASAVDPALSCLVAVSSQRRVRPQIVSLGAVPALGKLLARRSTPPPAAEKALKLMEAVSTCPEGRAAICDDPAAVTAVVARMMKVSPAATEHAAVVLWSVCHLFRDRRAQEAVAASNGLTKILLLMQSNCSPAAREMAGDLLRIFRVGSKSCLPACDFKTTHIMPF